MRIYVKTLTGKTLTFEVEPEESIRILKAKIQEREGIPVDQQFLIYDEIQLSNGCALYHYKVQNEATLHLAGSMRLLVKTLSCPQETILWVDPHEHVERIKLMVPHLRGFPLTQLFMNCDCGGKVTRMEDGRKLSDYDMEESIVYMGWHMFGPNSLPVPEVFKHI